MPELPEVQTIVTDLQKIVGDQFTGFVSHVPKAIKKISVANFAKEIQHKKIQSVDRLGKIILIKLADGKSIGIHLKMTGKILLTGSRKLLTESLPEKHLHHIFYLKKNGSLDFFDVRKFATISLLTPAEVELIRTGYGIDPISDKFSLQDLQSLLTQRKNKQLKLVLMDNSVILGIGNIYASEILFDAKILPHRIASSLTPKEISRLHTSIKKILRLAIRLRGTSISDYRDASGKMGGFQKVLKVYKKNGQKCQVCATIIEKSIIGQRSTFFCPGCQH